MPSGGARSGAGRPPDPNALRRDRKDDATWLVLPSEARKDPAPDWPLEVITPREFVVWESLWRKPIAAVWVRDQQLEQVAMYARTFVECEEIGVMAARRTLLRQLAGELLLTIPAMLSARVRIATDEVAERRAKADEPKPKTSRERVKVLPGARRSV